MAATAQPGERQSFSWFVFGLMASVTFVGLLSEMVPSGILPQIVYMSLVCFVLATIIAFLARRTLRSS